MRNFITHLILSCFALLCVSNAAATTPQKIVVIVKDHVATTYSPEYKVIMGPQVIGDIDSVALVDDNPTFYITIHPAYVVPVSSTVTIEKDAMFDMKLEFVSSGRRLAMEIDTFYVSLTNQQVEDKFLTSRIDQFFYKLNHDNEQVDFLRIDTLNEEYKVGYTEYSEEFELYAAPYLISKSDTTRILNYDGYVTDGFEVSPNNKYFYAAGLDIGWVETGDTTFLHDRWSCMLIELKTARIKRYLFDDCDGTWNEKDQWIVEDEIIFPIEETED